MDFPLRLSRIAEVSRFSGEIFPTMKLRICSGIAATRRWMIDAVLNILQQWLIVG